MAKKVTMKDIANQLSLSINAVSLALNDRSGVSEETRRLILNTAEELGYLDQSDKYIPTYSSKNICILLKTIYFNDMHFYGKILLGLEEVARKQGYDVLINSYEEDYKIPACIENHKVAGIIVVGKIEDDFLLQLKTYSIPVQLVDHTSLLESTDSILTDNRLGAFKATKYLIDKGFTEIGFFGDLDYSLSIQERYWGYKESLRLMPQFNTYDDVVEYVQKYSLLNHIEPYVLTYNTEKLVERIASVLQIPQAFVCSNDNAAIQLCNALRVLGYRIPEDISVIGFDDIDLCTMVVPKITTIRVNKELMGRKAMECLLWRLDHKKAAIEKIMMNVDIVERDSVKK